MLKFVPLIFLILLSACVTEKEFVVDYDDDGYDDVIAAETGGVLPGDCNDGNASVNPGATELCDGVDNNCDGVVDEDADGDGVAVCDDCDDTDATIYYGATELCDGLDNDCDGEADEDAVDWYRDQDGDGYGEESRTGSCDETPEEGYVLIGDDCADANDTAYPGATELCDGIDNDCDGIVDDGWYPDIEGGVTLYRDEDGDGYGDTEETVEGCHVPAGTSYVILAGDCNDSNSFYHPWAAEDDCGDPNDYNCDGSTGYADADADGFVACKECDDVDGSVNPDADEVCEDDADNDCDGDVDEATCEW